ncbi:FAD-dependent oxidoreductase [Devosia chinhatensis]|uniref:FAD/NAD(P)-binding domain-containing protein n=1 Tax=Devosia chinhatensis TaxID=429727 RepID=A0A0F5FKI0_9HYPH|nr:FAD-dependent oxidoreductase [Devosia chinhatensis]KKB09050.1 hypothetical protein VE26_03205 [Devosia chinhatensis]
MKDRVNRLPAEQAGAFAGAAIDRSQPIAFRLDGRRISGFVGDTVLSAVLASGVDTLGEGDWPVGLTTRTAPAIQPAGAASQPLDYLPMDRTPAVDGADFVTLGAARRYPFSRFLPAGRSLGVDVTLSRDANRPWLGAEAVAAEPVDLIVVGGGVSGMEAALVAAKSGLSVLLVERSRQLGGHSGLFGRQDDEHSPQADIDRLRTAISASDGIAVMVGSEAFAVHSGLVRVHRAELPRGSVIDVRARHIVLATGSRELLPVFDGNRLPGVMGTLDAHGLASHYGIWCGRSALFATTSSAAYRLAMQASDAGIAIPRILEARATASSRFIAFSRAYGMIQMPATSVEMVSPSRRGRNLVVTPTGPNTDPLSADALIVCGGWQPDLSLWHMAGGSSLWQSLRHRLEPVGNIDGIALAGSAAGYFTRRGCIESGRDAVDHLLGRTRKPVTDPVIDVLHESADGPLPVSPHHDGAPAYLDAERLMARPRPARRHLANLFGHKRRSGTPSLADAAQALDITDVVAGIALGLVPEDAAGIVAQERVALVSLGGGTAERKSTNGDVPPADEVPTYLSGRYGGDATLMRIIPSETRRLSTGALIYRNSDMVGPTHSVGVVLRALGDHAIALVQSDLALPELAVTVRDQGRAISAKTADLGDSR